MSTVVLKLFAGLGNGWSDRRTGEHKHIYEMKTHVRSSISTIVIICVVLIFVIKGCDSYAQVKHFVLLLCNLLTMISYFVNQHTLPVIYLSVEFINTIFS